MTDVQRIMLGQELAELGSLRDELTQIDVRLASTNTLEQARALARANLAAGKVLSCARSLAERTLELTEEAIMHTDDQAHLARVNAHLRRSAGALRVAVHARSVVDTVGLIRGLVN